MIKSLLPICLLFCCFTTIKITAQNTSDCVDLKTKISDAIKNSKTIRISYSSRARNTYVDYEQDASANTHLVYRNTGEKNIRLALIKMKDKTYATNSEGEWRSKITAKFNYSAWTDSCVNASQIFSKTFQNCSFSKDIAITGTTYSIYNIQIENDSFKIWIHKTTNSIKRIVGMQKDVSLEWEFDLPFEIVSAENGLKEYYNNGFSVFPPAYVYDESHDGIEPVFSIPSVTPEFKGGQSELFSFLGKKIRYPNDARKNGIEGTVYVGFIVEKDGSVSNVNIKRGISTDCNNEALRVVKLMNGKWQPGSYKGQNVRVAYTLPIKFKLE